MTRVLALAALLAVGCGGGTKVAAGGMTPQNHAARGTVRQPVSRTPVPGAPAPETGGEPAGTPSQ
jgi:hypothetical protein